VSYRSAIELWDLNKSPSSPPSISASTKPFNISAKNLKNLRLSVSLDGSQIAASGNGSPFKLYEHNQLKSRLVVSDRAQATDLASFEGQGSFHKGTGSQKQAQDDEMFIAVDKNIVSIYGVTGTWKFLRVIHHTSPRTSNMILDALSTERGVNDRFYNRHFICRNKDTERSEARDEIKSVFIWNLDSGRLVRTIMIDSYFRLDTDSLSSDGSLLLVESDGVISSICSRSGAHLATVIMSLVERFLSGEELPFSIPTMGSSEAVLISLQSIRPTK